MTNVFIELHESRCGGSDQRFGSGWENLFTEQFAFFLSADPLAATAVARLFLGGTEVMVASVSTQTIAVDGIPDLRFDFTDGSCLHIENKIDSPLGPRQLERYLNLGRVALVTRCNQSVPVDVLSHAAYCRPRERDCFHWFDVYRALVHADSAPAGFGALRDYFKGYMRELGLAPSALTSEWRRLFEERTASENQTIQRDFGRLLDPVKANLRRRGLKVQDVSHKGKQAYAPAGSAWRHLYVQPKRVRADFLESADCAAFEPGYEGLVVELVFDSAEMAVYRQAYEALRTKRREFAEHHWFVMRPRAIGSDRFRLWMARPLAPFLKDDSDLSGALCREALRALGWLIAASGRDLTACLHEGGTDS